MGRICKHTIGSRLLYSFFFFNDTATTEIYTLSLHDALPISTEASTSRRAAVNSLATRCFAATTSSEALVRASFNRSEEHTSELQSQSNLVCRLLLEKKNRLIMPHEQTGLCRPPRRRSPPPPS